MSLHTASSRASLAMPTSRIDVPALQHASQSASPSVRIAFVQASWHKDIVDRAYEGFVDAFAGGLAGGLEGRLEGSLEKRDPARDTVERFVVPGAFELPLHAQSLARTGRYDAVVCAALVVDGGIYRHDFVAAAVVDGLMRVQLDTGVPVFSVSLTPHHFHAGEAHLTFFREHFVKKGAEAAQACRQTLSALARIREADSDVDSHAAPDQPAPHRDITSTTS